MSAIEIAPGIYKIPLGIVNAYLLEADSLVLIDAGLPGSSDKILGAIIELGHQPDDIHYILVSHCHADHTGSLAVLKKRCGAEVYMHPLDAALLREGKTMRPTVAAPGLINRVMYTLMPLFGRTKFDMVESDNEISGGERLDFAGDLQVISTPGHTVGHLSFLSERNGGVLITGDAASNMFGLGYPPIFEDLAEGQRSLAKIAALDFEIACFGHGKTIRKDATARLRAKWGQA